MTTPTIISRKKLLLYPENIILGMENEIEDLKFSLECYRHAFPNFEIVRCCHFLGENEQCSSVLLRCIYNTIKPVTVGCQEMYVCSFCGVEKKYYCNVHRSENLDMVGSYFICQECSKKRLMLHGSPSFGTIIED